MTTKLPTYYDTLSRLGVVYRQGVRQILDVYNIFDINIDPTDWPVTTPDPCGAS